jgi:HTH-type transcriptional regulator / antitoxin HigA
MMIQQDYERLLAQVEALLDEVGTDETHPLYEFLDTLGTILQAYEEKQYPIPTATGAEVLPYLMAEHGLRQADLPEIGSQGVVSEVLAGKRELNLRQVRALAARFGVSPAVFL